MIQSIRDLKSRYALKIKYISSSKENLELLSNIRIILTSNKMQLLQKQQFVNYINKILNIYAKQQNFIFNILRFLSKNIENMHSSLAN